MRPTPLLLLLVTLLAGCSSLGYDDYRRGHRGDARAYENRRATRSYPAWARVTDRGRTAYVMCHKDRRTRTVRTNSVRGHLRHGDRFGSCRSDRRARQDRRGRRYDRNDRRRDRREERRRDRHHDDDDD